MDFCDDWGPDIIQYLGDSTNGESCNHWKLAEGIQPDVHTVTQDYDDLKKVVLNPFHKAQPRAETVYHIGNHEDWFYQAMQRDPKARGLYSLERNIDLNHYHMRVVPLNHVVHWGYLHYTHGVYTNQYHAAKTALHYRKCLVYGHIHDIQEHTIVSPIDVEEKIFAKSVGCLCTLNPDYARNLPSRWINAFHIAYVREDGTFNEYTIVVTRGRFTINNKEYKTCKA